MSSERTLCAAFQARVAERGEQVALRTRGGERELTWAQYGAGCATSPPRCTSWAAARRPLALMLRNRLEFHLVDAAAMQLGAIAFSIYNTAPPEQVETCSRPGRGWPSSRRTSAKVVAPTTRCPPPELEARGAASSFDVAGAARAAEPDDVLTLIYTSGTTGEPKGSSSRTPTSSSPRGTTP